MRNALQAILTAMVAMCADAQARAEGCVPINVFGSTPSRLMR
jgi:hypothetical protein